MESIRRLKVQSHISVQRYSRCSVLQRLNSGLITLKACSNRECLAKVTVPIEVLSDAILVPRVSLIEDSGTKTQNVFVVEGRYEPTSSCGDRSFSWW